MKNILLCGHPRVGKTTLILKVIEGIKGIEDIKVAGFTTSEILKGKERVGFKITSLDGEEAVMAHVDFKSEHKVGKYKVDVEAVEDVGANALIRGKAANADILVIDEIGKMELFSDLMQLSIADALDSKKRVLGTILEAQHYFTEKIKSREDTLIIEVTGNNRDQLVADIVKMLKMGG